MADRLFLSPMRRPILVILPLLCLLGATPLAAQPWAGEAERAAGRDALASAFAGRTTDAEATAASADPLVRKIVTWDRLQRRGQAGPGELVRFVAENPDWPFPETLLRRTEETLALDPDDGLALAHFARFPAKTLAGAGRHAEALMRAGRGAEATAVIRAAWVEAPADAGDEGAVLGRFGTVLTVQDQQQRFDRLSWLRSTNDAARQAMRLEPGARALAEMRLSIAAGRTDLDSAAPFRDIGILYERARALRRADRDAEAAVVWAQAVPYQTATVPEEGQRAIWAERQILARKTLRLGDPATAYAIAVNHGQTAPGLTRQEAEFFAGWLALRKLNDPAHALAHFAAVDDGSHSVITRARSAYWQGRALVALRRLPEARAQYAIAATLPTAFYGQLAALALDPSPRALSERIVAITPSRLTPAMVDGFARRDMVRAVVALGDLDQSSKARIFLLRLEELAPDANDRVMIARLGRLIGRPDHAVWIARRAGADGVMILPEGWPTPVTLNGGGRAEPALVYSIARQESNFDPSAVSGSNARGLMQLLPGTASDTARKLGIAHRTSMLTQDPAHNLLLGSAYLSEMLDRFNGSVALAAAGYNAGPRRADEWISTYGDPRAGTDPIDWIEQIPFSETRNYVQRIIENLIVYRAYEPDAAGRDHPLRPWLEALR